jgi:hypothetical protein
MLWSFDPQWMLGADGADVLVYRTRDEAPVWRFGARSPVTAVALSGGHAIVLASDGTVGWFDPATGQLRASTTVRAGALDLVADAWGSALVVYADSLVILDSTGARTIAAPPDARLVSASFAGQSRLIAAGTAHGHAHFFDGASGGYGGSLVVSDKPIRSLTGVHHGRWLATAGDAVHDVTLTGAVRFTSMPNEELGLISFDAASQCFGLQFGAKGTIFIDFRTKETRINASYPERLVRGVGVVGPYGYAVGLDLGDANRFDLQGQTCRTEPHPGRPRNRWVLLVGR